mgnify:CR=1 FL=1
MSQTAYNVRVPRLKPVLKVQGVSGASAIATPLATQKPSSTNNVSSRYRSTTTMMHMDVRSSCPHGSPRIHTGQTTSTYRRGSLPASQRGEKMRRSVCTIKHAQIETYRSESSAALATFTLVRGPPYHIQFCPPNASHVNKQYLRRHEPQDASQ